MDDGGPPVMTCVLLDRADVRQRLRVDYLRTLVAPMDGMWESTEIARAACWDIQDRGRHAGYFCLGSGNELLRFHLEEEYQARARQIFRWIVVTHDIRRAVAGTIEPPYFSLCLDFQSGIEPHSFLFRDHRRVEALTPPGESIFTRADTTEVDELTRFYRAQIEGPGEWIEAFVRKRIARRELFALRDRRQLIAAGECIPSPTQPPYADLGVLVARPRRGRGLGTFVLAHMKTCCYQAGWKPICSCAAGNVASKRAIEKAGFVSEHRMVTMLFPESV